jgi:hypothetical protein
MGSIPVNRETMVRRSRKATVNRAALIGAALVALAACGTNYLPGDEAMSCAELQSEIAANDAQIATHLAAAEAAEESGVRRPTGTLAGMSFSLTASADVDRIEARSLGRRNGHLTTYATNKGC